ncbi:flavin-containing monooxygenase [Amycolatopsis jejuensis]|uniref:flavin-containing monooxygenase n=1 Tax=Amycolatopsis jejuensis TaxID=330084 RepID=UPI000526547B|nr:NAD(P)/FAD-dependent oxidoreductase [Amycolatopsis jejuensis]
MAAGNPDSSWAAEGYDAEAVRRKYREERDKRVRADGPDQYRVVAGDPVVGKYAEDPYAERAERAPVTDEVEVAVIGAGFAGMLLGARMRQIGVERVRVVEAGGDFGGTWYWNRYPGVACDVESYVYLPLLEEVGYVPTEKYAKGPEIFEYCRRFARHFDLYRDALLHTRVTDLRWNEEDAVWIVSTDRGDRFRARYVCMTFGTFLHPKLPGIPGIEDFKGRSFHTSRWDFGYTGGDSYGNLEHLRDKRVGVIGSGATGVQVVPMVAKDAKELVVFQRTPAIVDVRENRPTDPAWAAALAPGWQRERIENFSACIAGESPEVDLVDDAWTRVFHNFRKTRSVTESEAETMELIDFRHMETIRGRIAGLVDDPATAEALKPYYRFLCKRPCFHDEYLQAFNRPNVTLVDTAGKGPDAVSENGVVVGGKEYPLDCLIFATGFASIRQNLRDRLGYDVHGPNGQALSDKWKDGISTLFGTQTHGFPNFFIVSYFQSGIASNQAHTLDVLSQHISTVVREARDRNARTVDITEDAEDDWVRTVVASSTASAEFLESCTPSYYNNEGRPNVALFRRNGPYAAGILPFSRLLENWRSTGDYAGLVFTL